MLRWRTQQRRRWWGARALDCGRVDAAHGAGRHQRRVQWGHGRE